MGGLKFFKTKKVMETKANVFDVAEYILSQKGKMTAVKLQKLVYYCQVWSLVWDDVPLFEENIEAWVNGPVVPLLYEVHKGMYNVENGFSKGLGNTENIQTYQKDSIDAVLSFYAGKTSKWLVDLTHLETPWIEARKGLGELERGNRLIPLESMLEYYASLETNN